MSAIRDDVIKIIAEYMSVPADEVKNMNEETGVFMDMGMNSFELGSVIDEVEDRFNISIAAEEFEKVAKIGDIINLVGRRLKSRGDS